MLAWDDLHKFVKWLEKKYNEDGCNYPYCDIDKDVVTIDGSITKGMVDRFNRESKFI